MALPAPVDRRHREAAVAQVAHGLEIFLDRFAAPLEDAHRALASRRRRPARKAQFRAVRGLDGAADDVLRNRIGGDRDQRHGADRIGEKSRESRAGVFKNGSDSTLLNTVWFLPYHLRA